MDESWRMRIGVHNAVPPRKSMEVGNTRHSYAPNFDPDDFADVFGGPPRTVISRKSSGQFTTSSFYSEVFRNPSPELSSPIKVSGRTLPAYTIPARNEGFYDDIFVSDDGRKSRQRSRPESKPKSNSSSVLSSEELSPLRPVDGDDVALSSITSKLRPLNVPCRWNSTTMTPADDRQRKQSIPSFQSNHPYSYNEYMEKDNNDKHRSTCYSFSRHVSSPENYSFSRHVSSPETISLEPNSFRSVKISGDDLELNSLQSPASSICQEPEAKNCSVQSNTVMQEQEVEQEEDEVMSSYVIEINSDYNREGNGEAVSIDDAIAWAKERCQSSSQTQGSSIQHEEVHSTIDSKERSKTGDLIYQQFQGNRALFFPMEDIKNRTTEENQEEEEERKLQIEITLLEEDIRLWSAGKESNIRLLLSTLDHMLWPNSGWQAVALTSLIDSSQVKKAYQKARLCLHPDKLQQRGATPQQKYIADKVFSILQDAWTAFISADVFFK